MNTEKRLRQDAVRFSNMTPPPDLRGKLQASLEAVPPVQRPVQVARPVRKWFSPAVAILSLAMIFVFISTFSQPQAGLLDYGDAGILTEQTDGIGTSAIDPSVPDTGSEIPLGRVGMFSGLALLTGYLCFIEFKERSRLLKLSLSALAVFTAVALIFMLGLV